MEMRHLLTNPKYKELWDKTYTTELARLAQGISGVNKGTNTMSSSSAATSPLTGKGHYLRLCLTSSVQGESATQLQLVKTSSTVTKLFLYSRRTSKAQINSTPSSHSWL
jgi:hypothetical protein